MELQMIEDLVSSEEFRAYRQGSGTKQWVDLRYRDVKVMTERGFSKINKVIRHRTRKRLFRVSTNAGSVVVTEDHSLLRSDATKISPQECKIGTPLLHWDMPLVSGGGPDDDVVRKFAFAKGLFFGGGQCGFSNSEQPEAWFTLRCRRREGLTTAIFLFNSRYKGDKVWLRAEAGGSSMTPRVATAASNVTALVREWTREFYTSRNEKKVPQDVLFGDVDIKHRFFLGVRAATTTNSDTMVARGQLGAQGLYTVLADIGCCDDMMLSVDADAPADYRMTLAPPGTLGDKADAFTVRTIEDLGEANAQCVYDLETESHHFAAGVGRLVVHNTDSLYVSYAPDHYRDFDREYFTGKCDKIEYGTLLVRKTFEQIEIAKHLVNEYLRRDNGTSFLKMAYEEVLYPVAFLSKKKYYGVPHEENVDFYPRKLFLRGLEVVKRGSSEVLKDVVNEVLHTTMDIANTRDIIDVVEDAIKRVFNTEWPIDAFAKTKPNVRFKYVICKYYPWTYDIQGRQTKNTIGACMELVQRVKDEGLEIDLEYYFDNELTGQFARLITFCPVFEKAIPELPAVNTSGMNEVEIDALNKERYTRTEDALFKAAKKHIGHLAKEFSNSARPDLYTRHLNVATAVVLNIFSHSPGGITSTLEALLTQRLRAVEVLIKSFGLEDIVLNCTARWKQRVVEFIREEYDYDNICKSNLPFTTIWDVLERRELELILRDHSLFPQLPGDQALAIVDAIAKAMASTLEVTMSTQPESEPSPSLLEEKEPIPVEHLLEEEEKPALLELTDVVQESPSKEKAFDPTTELIAELRARAERAEAAHIRAKAECKEIKEKAEAERKEIKEKAEVERKEIKEKPKRNADRWAFGSTKNGWLLETSWDKAYIDLDNNVKALTSTRPLTTIRKDGRRRGYAVAVKQDSEGALIRVVPGLRMDVEKKLDRLEKVGFNRVIYHGRDDYFNPSANPDDFIDNVCADGDQYLNEELEDKAIETSPVDFNMIAIELFVPNNHESVTLDNVIHVLERVQYETSERAVTPAVNSTLTTCNTSCRFTQYQVNQIAARLKKLENFRPSSQVNVADAFGLAEKTINDDSIAFGPISTVKLERGAQRTIYTGIKVASCARGGSVVIVPYENYVNRLQFNEQRHGVGLSEISVNVVNISTEFIRVDISDLLFTFAYEADDAAETAKAERAGKLREEQALARARLEKLALKEKADSAAREAEAAKAKDERKARKAREKLAREVKAAEEAKEEVKLKKKSNSPKKLNSTTMPTKRRALVQLQSSVGGKRGRTSPVKPLEHTSIVPRTPAVVLRPEVFSMVAYHFFTLTDWEPFFDEKTEEPMVPWVTQCFLEWSARKPVDWSRACRSASPWMTTILQLSKKRVDWMQFTSWLGDDDDFAWKLPLLQAAARSGKLTWKHWRRLSQLACEWMIPLFDEYADKIYLEEFFHYDKDYTPIHKDDTPIYAPYMLNDRGECDECADRDWIDYSKESQLQPWKSEFVKRNVNELDWREMCRHAHEGIKFVFEEMFDKIIFSAFFKTRAPWKTLFLESNKKQFNWAAVDKQTWKYLSRDARSWMPLDEYFDCIDLNVFFDNGANIPEVEDLLKNELDIVPTKKKPLGAQRPFAKPTFQKNRAEILRKVFDVQQFETSNRKFADEVKTNGYGASILLIRPVTTTSVTVVEKKKATRDKKSKIKTPKEIAEADSFAKDLFKLRDDYSPDVLIEHSIGARVEGLRREARATVVSMDEYRTSVTCSCCHKRLTQTRLFTKVKRKEDETDIRL
ncbi:hypothetical protein JG688_00015367 [Phytophthora aleatoria]|uniref:DNA-directed DNA polymerase n=1 Tax=Phytophthora aleatoria TaxID=2496075 RepID=A0A8J5I609_9STRA|nr:hypothetical protein JG688_00015367 [Phytophthora aleatoria]